MPNATMKLELITLSGVKRNADVRRVSLRSADGQISILPGHEPLVTLAESGIISVLHEGQEEPEHFAAFGGIVEVSPTRVRILVDEADSADEILTAEAEGALESAVALKAAAKTQVELAQAQVLIDRHTTRLKVAGFRRRHH
jgi:F-type H+-transporting ATPase subunit epsilon